MPAVFKIKRIFFSLIFAAISVSSFAQVSLLPEHMEVIDEVTVMRDFKNENRWYYVPQKPVLLEKAPEDAKDPKPAFQLLTYQSEQDEKLYEGGMLQFSISMKIPEKSRLNILKRLKTKVGYKKAPLISLAPLPFKLADATIYDAEGKYLTRKPQAPGLAPAYVTGALPFQIQLDKFGAQLYSALVDKQNAGVGVLTTLTYDGIIPPAGFKVTVDWDQTYKHLSKNNKLRIAFSSILSGFEVGVSKEKISKELISNECIKVESLTNEKITQSEIDKYLEPILSRISAEMIDKIKAPMEIDPSKQKDENSLEKCFFPFRVESSLVLKNIKNVRKGSEVITLNQITTVTRKTACGSFIGINEYPESIKPSLIRTMPLNSWASAFLMLPAINNAPDMHLNSVTMTANVVDSNGKPVPTLNDTARWSPQHPDSWKNKDGENVGSLKFPLLALFDKHNNKIEEIRKEYQFKVEVNIAQKLKNLSSINITYNTPLFNGDLPLAAPVDLVENFVVDASALTFGQQNLKKVKIILTEGKNKMEYSFSSKKAEDRSVIFIIKSSQHSQTPEKILPKITFDSKDQRNIPWEHNNKDLRESDSFLYLMLFDSDWQKEEL